MKVVTGGAEPPLWVIEEISPRLTACRFLEELIKAMLELERWSGTTTTTVPLKIFAIPTALQD
jgi:hypothetical protein